MTMEEQNSADVIAVSTLIYRYFRCLDTHDAVGMVDCLVEDFEAFHTLIGNVKGRTNFMEVVMATVPGLKITQHYCMNQEITVHGDEAVCLSYLYAQHVVSADGDEDVLMPGGGRYRHECVRTAKGWKIMRLRIDVTWMDPRLADVFRPDLT